MGFVALIMLQLTRDRERESVRVKRVFISFSFDGSD